MINTVFSRKCLSFFQNFDAQASWSRVHGTADQYYADKMLELFANNAASF